MRKNLFDRIYAQIITLQWLQEYEDSFEETAKLCDTDEQLDLLFHLVKNFTYLNSASMKKTIDRLVCYLNENIEIDPNSTQICPYAVNASADSSFQIMQFLKPTLAKYNLENIKLTNIVGQIRKNLPERNTIILVDEFVGTGKTLSSRIQTIRKDLKIHQQTTELKYDFTIIPCAIACVEDSRNYVKEATGLDLQCILSLKKGISGYFGEEIAVRNKATMAEIERKLDQSKDLNLYQGKFPTMGWGEAEALFYQEASNIPNSVFPIFWWKYLLNGRTRKPMFNRWESD